LEELPPLVDLIHSRSILAYFEEMLSHFEPWLNFYFWKASSLEGIIVYVAGLYGI
jgi:hypothetical protein